MTRANSKIRLAGLIVMTKVVILSLLSSSYKYTRGVLAHNNILIITQPWIFSRSNGNSSSVAMATAGHSGKCSLELSFFCLPKRPRRSSHQHTRVLLLTRRMRLLWPRTSQYKHISLHRLIRAFCPYYLHSSPTFRTLSTKFSPWFQRNKVDINHPPGSTTPSRGYSTQSVARPEVHKFQV